MKPLSKKISDYIIEGSDESHRQAKKILESLTGIEASRVILDITFSNDRVVDDIDILRFMDYIYPLE